MGQNISYDFEGGHIHEPGFLQKNVCAMVKVWYLVYFHPSYNWNPDIMGI